jgi:hypothetical protein
VGLEKKKEGTGITRRKEEGGRRKEGRRETGGAKDRKKTPK